MQLQITGQITGMEARNGGWVAVAITEPGNQYPKKLSTKKPELIQQAQALMGQSVTALYNEQESTQINPHSGSPYINRYLEALSLAGQQAPQPTVVTHPTATSNAYPTITTTTATAVPDLREDRIMRQSAAKVSVELLQHLDPSERTLSSLVAISEKLVRYFKDGVPWVVNPVEVGPDEPQGDDGIPF